MRSAFMSSSKHNVQLCAITYVVMFITEQNPSLVGKRLARTALD